MRDMPLDLSGVCRLHQTEVVRTFYQDMWNFAEKRHA